MLCLYGCSEKNINQTEKNEISIQKDVICLEDHSPILKKIKIQEVKTSPYQAQFSTSGVVKAIPSSYAEIASPFSGRIVHSFVRLGQSVRVGSPLFSISSPSFSETGKNYFDSKQEMEQALKNLKREKDLLSNGVGVAKEVEEAELNYQLKKQNFENAKSALRVFQVDPGQLKLGEALIVRSPIAGKVVVNHILLGQYIKEEDPAQAVVADLSKVWVVAHVKEKDIPLMEHLQAVEIRLSASKDEPIHGRVYHISEMLDEATRSAEVIIECDNKQGRIKPFMYGNVLLTEESKNVIQIPTSAILQEEESIYVLIAKGKNQFRKVPIVVSDNVEDRSVVSRGLKVGDKIVAEGAFYLLDSK